MFSLMGFLIVVGFILATWVACLEYKAQKSDKKRGIHVEASPSSLFGVVLFMWAIVTLVITGVATGITEDKVESVEREEKQLLSLNDNLTSQGNIDGSFLLIAGDISGEMNETFKYTWYEEEDDGAIHLRQLEATSDEVSIYQDADKGEAYIEYLYPVTTRSHPKWVTPIGAYSREVKKDPEETSDIKYELHVPPGTVVKDFSLDSK